jgi:hypothetical protein
VHVIEDQYVPMGRAWIKSLITPQCRSKGTCGQIIKLFAHGILLHTWAVSGLGQREQVFVKSSLAPYRTTLV